MPWLILVPETAPTLDLLDLPNDARNLAMDEAVIAAHFIRVEFGTSKINFAAIGNIVSQLHLHVVGRRANDPYWPAPVWGNVVEATGYSAARIAMLTATLIQNHSLKTY